MSEGVQKPPFRLLAPKPTRSDSSTTIWREALSSIAWTAAHRPLKPPPMITRSADKSPIRALASGTPPTVSFQYTSGRESLSDSSAHLFTLVPRSAASGSEHPPRSLASSRTCACSRPSPGQWTPGPIRRPVACWTVSTVGPGSPMSRSALSATNPSVARADSLAGVRFLVRSDPLL